MAAPAVAVVADVDDVAAVQEPVEERGGHDLVAEDAAPLLEACGFRRMPITDSDPYRSPWSE